MTIPHYWNPQQVERFLDSLAVLGLRRARVAALIMWRSGLRVGETVALEWRDIDLTASSLLIRRGKGGKGGKGGRGRTVPLHPDLASLFANWPTSYGPRDLVVGLTWKTSLRHLRAGIEHADLDQESPGTGRQRAGAHSLRHSAARHWLTTAGNPAECCQPVAGACDPGGDAPHIPSHRGQHPLHGGRPVGSRFELPFTGLRRCETVASSVVAETSLKS